MNSSLPVIHSIIDASAIASLISERWDLPQPIHCELLTRGMNDVYLVKDGSLRSWACRVWRSGFRSESDVKYETAFLSFLDTNHIPVPTALAAKDGNLYQPVSSIEGLRFCSVFSWVAGNPFGEDPDPKGAFLLGEVFGKMHKLVEDFSPSEKRFVDSSSKLRKEVIAVQKMTRHRSGESEWYAKAAESLASALDEVSSTV